MANQSHVAPVGTSLSEVWRKNFAQLERETEGEKELGSSEEERDRNQKSRKQISSRFSLFFFFNREGFCWGGCALNEKRKTAHAFSRHCSFFEVGLRLSFEVSGCEKRAKV